MSIYGSYIIEGLFDKFKNKKQPENKKEQKKQIPGTLKQINSSDIKLLDELALKEAYCAEGMNLGPDKSIDFLVNYINSWENVNCNNINIYWLTGKTMNNAYSLTTDNKYPDDLTIVLIDWSNFGNKFDSVAYKYKFRWFSDVVDNNAKREINKKNPKYKNYMFYYDDGRIMDYLNHKIQPSSPFGK